MKNIDPKNSSIVDRYKIKLKGVLNKKKHIITEEEEFKIERSWFGEAGRLMTTIGLFLITIVNFNTMYDGIYQELERSADVPIGNSLLACIISGTIAILIFLAWYALYSYATRCLTSWARKVAYTFSFILLAFIFIASSTPTFMGLTHSITRPMHMFDKTTEAAAMINIITDSSRDAKAVIPTLEGLKREACSSRDLESGTGIISRTGRGVGVATGAFNSACEGTAGVLASIELSIGKANHSASQINETLERLFVLVDDRHIPVLEREDGFKKSMASLDRLIREFHNDGLGKAVESGVVTLNSLVSYVDENSGMNKGARTAINGIHSKLKNAAEQLKTIISDDDGRVLKSVEHRSTLTEITFHYMHRFPTHIAMSAFLDFFPFFIFWALILFHTKQVSASSEIDQLDDQLYLNDQIPFDLFEKKGEDHE